LLERDPEPLHAVGGYVKRAVNTVPEQDATTGHKGVIKLYKRDVNNIPEQEATTGHKGVIKLYKREEPCEN
jgi:hypothetical protein